MALKIMQPTTRCDECGRLWHAEHFPDGSSCPAPEWKCKVGLLHAVQMVNAAKLRTLLQAVRGGQHGAAYEAARAIEEEIAG